MTTNVNVKVIVYALTSFPGNFCRLTLRKERVLLPDISEVHFTFLTCKTKSLRYSWGIVKIFYVVVRQPTDYVVRRVCTINLNTKEGMNPTEATVCKLWGKTTLYDSSATQVEVLQFMASTTDKVPGSESMLALCERCCKSDDGTSVPLIGVWVTNFCFTWHPLI